MPKILRDVIEIVGAGPLLTDIEEAVGWPVVDPSWKPISDNISGALVELFKRGLKANQLMGIDSNRDLKNSSNYILTITEGTLAVSYPEDLTKGTEKVENYLDVLVVLALHFGAKNESDIRSQMKDALDMEIWVANNSMDVRDTYNLTLINNYMTVEQLIATCPEIDWLLIINSYVPTNITFDKSLLVAVTNPAYIAKLSEKLKNTDEKTIRNYLAYRAVLPTTLQLDSQSRDIFRKFRKTVLKKNDIHDYVYCISMSEYFFSHSISNMFIKKYISLDAKIEVTKLVESIRMVLYKTIKDAKWMDQNGREEAVMKLNAMKIFVGYPDPLLNDTLLNNHYSKVNVSKDEYYFNVRKLANYEATENFRTLVESNEKSDWRLEGKYFKTNAYYHISENRIDILAGFMGGTFFDIDRPKYSTYAGLGAVIGHELTHGYDNTGAQFDHMGNRRNWWSNETGKNFEELGSCIVDQYDNYTILGKQLDGELTLGENIADNGGLKQAYLAYMEWKKRNKHDKKLPGLDYTDEQMFWISFGSARCGEYTQKYIERAIKHDVHSLAEARVNVPLHNMPEFSEAFKCKKRSAMNPAEKCDLW